MKIKQSLYLEKKDLPKLKKRLASLGYSGQNWLAHFLEKVIREKIIFIDGDEITLTVGDGRKK